MSKETPDCPAHELAKIGGIVPQHLCTCTPEPQQQGTCVEKLSEEIHHLYCAQYHKDHGKPYWTGGDYSKLDERTKEYDRNIARFIHRLLESKAREIEKYRISNEALLMHDSSKIYNRGIDTALAVLRGDKK